MMKELNVSMASKKNWHPSFLPSEIFTISLFSASNNFQTASKVPLPPTPLVYIMNALLIAMKFKKYQGITFRVAVGDFRPPACCMKTQLRMCKACFKRCATAVLSWLDYSSTGARHQHDLVSDVEFNSVEQNGCCRKQNTKMKKRFSKLSNVF